MDATTSPALAERFELKGYPTLLLLSGGRMYNFDGPRTQDALEVFARGGFQDSAVRVL